MALEPITRQEQIVAGKDLKPITRMERFLKEYGAGGGGGGGGVVCTITGRIVDGEYVFTADRTFDECFKAAENNTLSVFYRTSQAGNYNTIRDFVFRPTEISMTKGDIGDGTFAGIIMFFYFGYPEAVIGDSTFSELNWNYEGTFESNA